MDAKKDTFDSSYWYVVNEQYRHIVYRNKDRSRAVRYAQNKNKSLSEDPTNKACYQVISGAQVNNGKVHAIGYLARSA